MIGSDVKFGITGESTNLNCLTKIKMREIEGMNNLSRIKTNPLLL